MTATKVHKYLISNHAFTKKLSLFFFAIFSALTLFAQRPTPRSLNQDTASQKVTIDFADTLDIIQNDGELIQKLLGNVELRQDSVYMYCDSAIITNSNQVVAQGNVIIQQGDSLNVFADSLNYDGEQKLATLYSKVVLDSKGQQLFTEELDYDLNTKVASYFTGALLTNGTTQLTSKRGYFYTDINEAYFKDSVVVIDPEFNMLSDTLKYNTSTQTAYFLGPTLIKSDTTQIYCEDGFYDTENELAEFRENAQFVKGQQQAVGEIIRYEGKTDTYSLIGEASFVENDRNATADTIKYNDLTNEVTLLGDAVYQDSTQYIAAQTIIYNSDKEIYKTRGRSYISDPPQILQADEVDYDNETGLGLAIGNVIWQDTSQQFTIVAEQAAYNQNTDYLKASGGRPLLITVIENDSLYLSSDTLISTSQLDTFFMAKKLITDSITVTNVQDSAIVSIDSIENQEVASVLDTIDTQNVETTQDTTNRILEQFLATQDSILKDLNQTLVQEDSAQILPKRPKLARKIERIDTSRTLFAYPDVRIFKSDLQSLCDSLTYSTKDSIFRFYENPIVWSDTSQFTADTIHMSLKDEKIDRIFLYQNSFIINSPDEFFFNQIKGNNSVAYFIDSELSKVDVKGNAESVYYALDDEDAYVGANKTQSASMLLYFGNNEVEKIKFYEQPTAKLEPMEGTDHETLKLAGFRWITEGRPRSVDDLLIVKPKPNRPIKQPKELPVEAEELKQDISEEAPEEEEIKERF
ncbi:MAG: OstA-like protein [Bacteroidota bacterium]